MGGEPQGTGNLVSYIMMASAFSTRLAPKQVSIKYLLNEEMLHGCLVNGSSLLCSTLDSSHEPSAGDNNGEES